MPHGMSDYDYGRMRYAVRLAVKEGRLIKPVKCQVCNQVRVLSGHHTSYRPENWLNVIWVCHSCHRTVHWQEEPEKFELDEFSRISRLAAEIDKFKAKQSTTKKKEMKQSKVQAETQVLVRRLLNKELL